MYASLQQKYAFYSDLFRSAARASGALLFLAWLGLVIREAMLFGPPASVTFPQAAALAIVFAGYLVGWRHELVGGMLAIFGTAAFFAVFLLTLDSPPQLDAAWFAAPGVFYLLAWRYDPRRGRLRSEAAMKIQRILFPTDFSHYNDAALKLASTLAAEADAVLYIIHVHDIRELNAMMGEGSYLYASSWDDERKEAHERLRKVVPTVPGLTYQHECLIGSPVSENLRFAESHGVDLIVLASHGRTGLPRLLMGSIAEGVMRKAKCPVLVVKQPAGEPETDAAVACHVAES